MKKVILAVMLVLMFSTTVVAATIKCEIVGMIVPEDPEGNTAVLMECKDPKELKVGDKLKIKISKPKTVIEGC